MFLLLWILEKQFCQTSWLLSFGIIWQKWIPCVIKLEHQLKTCEKGFEQNQVTWRQYKIQICTPVKTESVVHIALLSITNFPLQISSSWKFQQLSFQSWFDLENHKISKLNSGIIIQRVAKQMQKHGIFTKIHLFFSLPDFFCEERVQVYYTFYKWFANTKLTGKWHEQAKAVCFCT